MIQVGGLIEMSKELKLFVNNLWDSEIAYFADLLNKPVVARIKSKLLVKVINKLSSELGHPKDELVKLIKEMIKKGEL